MIERLIIGRSSKQPILVIIEDIHWADPVTLLCLASLTKTVLEQPALLVTTSRIEGDPVGQSGRTDLGASGFTSIELGPLRRQESLALIEGFVDVEDPLADDCLKRAAGTPFFLEQLLRTARDGDVKILPDSIQSLVIARLDRLSAHDKRALQCASVIGQRFEQALLNHLLDIKTKHLTPSKADFVSDS